MTFFCRHNIGNAPRKKEKEENEGEGEGAFGLTLRPHNSRERERGKENKTQETSDIVPSNNIFVAPFLLLSLHPLAKQ